MAQLHLYLAEDEAAEVRRRARARGLSVSRYLAELVRSRVSPPDWPEGYFTRVIGGWRGEPLERAPQPAFEVRDSL